MDFKEAFIIVGDHPRWRTVRKFPTPRSRASAERATLSLSREYPAAVFGLWRVSESAMGVRGYSHISAAKDGVEVKVPPGTLAGGRMLS